MKNIIFAFLVPFFAFSQNNKLDQKYGFEKYVFGTSPKEYSNLVLEIDEGAVQLYSYGQSFTRFENVTFEDVYITFNKDKLSTISFKTKNATGSKMLQNLKQIYGEPKKSLINKGDYEWLGVKVKLLYEPISTTDALITFYCRNIK